MSWHSLHSRMNWLLSISSDRVLLPKEQYRTKMLYRSAPAACGMRSTAAKSNDTSVVTTAHRNMAACMLRSSLPSVGMEDVPGPERGTLRRGRLD
jgi:hypothetical protein